MYACSTPITSLEVNFPWVKFPLDTMHTDSGKGKRAEYCARVVSKFRPRFAIAARQVFKVVPFFVIHNKFEQLKIQRDKKIKRIKIFA